MPIPADGGGRGCGCMAPIHSKPNTRRRWVAGTTLRPLYPRVNPGNHSKGGWVGLGARLDGTKNLASTVIRSLDHPARSE
jgi:hypothetical protein